MATLNGRGGEFMNDKAQGRSIKVRALAVGDRIDTLGLERPDTFSIAPLAFRVGANGRVALYRFGVVVLAGLTAQEEEEILASLKSRVSHQSDTATDEDAITVNVGGGDDKVSQGVVNVQKFGDERFIVVADTLAKSVGLARNESSVNAVFEKVEPFAADMASAGRSPSDRKAVLKLVGEAILLQHRLTARIAGYEKPKIVWDRPELERLYDRLTEEYEIEDRTETLEGKLEVVVENARMLAEVLDAGRAGRIELWITILIALEVVLSLWGIAASFFDN